MPRDATRSHANSRLEKMLVVGSVETKQVHVLSPAIVQLMGRVGICISEMMINLMDVKANRPWIPEFLNCRFPGFLESRSHSHIILCYIRILKHSYRGASVNPLENLTHTTHHKSPLTQSRCLNFSNSPSPLGAPSPCFSYVSSCADAPCCAISPSL